MLKIRQKSLLRIFEIMMTHVRVTPTGDRLTSDGVITLKTRKWETPSLNPGRACRPSRSELSMVFSETRVNTG